MAKPSSKRRFKYQSRSADDIKSRANQKSGNFDTMIKDKYKMFKPRDGKNLIRILPPTWEDARHYGLEVFVNYGIGVDNQSYLSLSKMKGEKDPLEEARREAEADGDTKLAAALSAKKRVLLWVIDRNDESEGPQIWSAPWTVDRDVATLCYDEDTGEIIEVDNPEDGCDLRFYKEGTGRNTKYNPAKMKLLKPSPVSDDEEQMDEWLRFVEENPLTECLEYFDYDHIKAVFAGVARVDDDDDDEDDRKKKKRTRARDDDEDEKSVRKKRRAVRDDDDDDDEDEEDEKPARKRVRDEDDDDEDEDEKPARKKRTSKSRDEEDDEDEEDEDDTEDDDDEEDEKPKQSIRERLKKRRRSSDD